MAALKTHKCVQPRKVGLILTNWATITLISHMGNINEHVVEYMINDTTCNGSYAVYVIIWSWSKTFCFKYGLYRGQKYMVHLTYIVKQIDIYFCVLIKTLSPDTTNLRGKRIRRKIVT